MPCACMWSRFWLDCGRGPGAVAPRLLGGGGNPWTLGLPGPHVMGPRERWFLRGAGSHVACIPLHLCVLCWPVDLHL